MTVGGATMLCKQERQFWVCSGDPLNGVKEAGQFGPCRETRLQFYTGMRIGLSQPRAK